MNAVADNYHVEVKMDNKLSESEEYLTFRSTVPLRQIVVDDDKEWKMFDSGPRSIKFPLICLPPLGSGAEVFYKQMIFLTSLNYRVIALDYPVYWSVEEFATGFRNIINLLKLNQVHIFACSLGAFLALKFLEQSNNRQYVVSLFLCNAFMDNSHLHKSWLSSTLWALPSAVLKRMLHKDFPTASVTDTEQLKAVEFTSHSLSCLNQKKLASRLSTCYKNDYARYLHHLQNMPVTLMDVYDDDSIPQCARDDMLKSFPYARQAHLKTGGKFPFLSRSSEVNLHLRLHLRPFETLPISPMLSAQPIEHHDR